LQQDQKKGFIWRRGICKFIIKGDKYSRDDRFRGDLKIMIIINIKDIIDLIVLIIVIGAMVKYCD
jgi:hypothetical protein